MSSAARRKRWLTLTSGATGPNWKVIASQVVPQIATQAAKSETVFTASRRSEARHDTLARRPERNQSRVSLPPILQRLKLPVIGARRRLALS
jgi:hypothetical protein